MIPLTQQASTASGRIFLAVSSSKKARYSCHEMCDIEGDPAVKVNPKAEYILEQRPYYVNFDDDD